MAATMTACAERLTFGDCAAAGIDPPNFARHKLDRLRELRAVIATLNSQSDAPDPLLTFILERERDENRWRD